MAEARESGSAERLYYFVTRHPWVIIATFLFACAVAVYVHASYARYDMTYRTMAPRHTPEAAAFEEFVKIFGEATDTFIIGFRDEPLVTNENLAMIDRVTRRLEEHRLTYSVTSLTNALDILGSEGTLAVTEFVTAIPQSGPSLRSLERRLTSDPVLANGLISRDGTTAAIMVRIAESQAEVDDWFGYFEDVERILAEEGKGRIEFRLAGYPYISNMLMRYMIEDTGMFIPLTLGLMCGLLWLVFGRVRAMWLPLTPVLIAATLALGALTACGLPMSLLTGQGVLTTLIIVIGLSDGVHLLSRYDEDLASDNPGGNRGRVLLTTLHHVGAACFLTSLTTAIGLISLSIADVPSVRDFGVFGALGIVFAYAGAIVFLPAALVLTERRWRAPVRRTATSQYIDRFLAAVAGLVARRPRAIIAAGCVVLVATAAMVPAARIDGRPTQDLKRTDPTRQALEFLEDNLGGAYPLEIVIEGSGADAIKDPSLLATVDYVKSGLELSPFIARVTSPVEFIKKMNRAMEENAPEAYALPATSDAVAQYLLLFEMAGSDAEFERLVNYDYSVARMTALTTDFSPEEYESIVEELERLKHGRLPPGTDIYASGEGPIWRRATTVLISTLIRSLYIAMPLVFVLTGLAFRSWRLGALSVLPNLLPITLALGLLAPLDITLRFSTITAFPLAFGLAIDDTIHFLARYRNEIAAGRTVDEAVRITITTTGRAMLLTSVLLVAGFSVMFVSNFLGIIHVATLISVILVAALFGDLLLLPALILTTQRASSRPEKR